MSHARITRRYLLGAMGAAGALAALPSCKGRGEQPGGAGARRIKIGLVVPQAGVYATVGAYMKNAWELWLERHHGKLGTFEVTTVIADEGETPQTGVPAIQKLLQSDQVDAIVGMVSSAVALGAQSIIAEARKLLIVANAGASDITGAKRSPYIWRTSFTNVQIASATGTYLAGQPDVGPVYLIAPDYAAGAEVIRGFKATFEARGGKIAGEAKPALGKTQDYQPFLAGIQASGARAVYCFFAGAEAVAFVKQYEQFGLSKQIPLYGSGFLTEGSVLPAQGDAALGIQTVLHYTTELDNSANKEFVAAWRAKFNAPPAVYSVQMWDAAGVLDRALALATALDGDSLGKALGSIGTIDDSPRGPWSFDNQSPRQKMYLRKVEKRGTEYINAVVADLGEVAALT
jgi:branched-chain amino acid transport system substrate-binding protein